MISLAKLYKYTARFDEADEQADKALTILRTRLPAEHPRTQSIIQLKADILAGRNEGT